MMIAIAAITLSLQLQRSSLDLLDGVNIEVAAHNSARAPVSVTFAKPTEYEIDLMRGAQVIWSSFAPSPPGAALPPHAREFLPGPTVLVIYIWNAVAADGTTPPPGDYVVRARLLGNGVEPEATATVHFIEPTPIAAVERLRVGDEVTIAGRIDATKQMLTDSTGTIKLARKLLGAAETPVAVRGYIMVQPDKSRVFYVKRWAAMK